MQYILPISGRRSILLCVLLALVSSGVAQSSAHRDRATQEVRKTGLLKPLHTLTTLREAHSLTLEEARRGYPVHLRAVVTYAYSYVDPQFSAFFLQDATGGIYAIAAPETSWPGRAPLPGTLVALTGITSVGDYAPILIQVHVMVLRKSHVPRHGAPVTFSRLLSGAEDSQWVEVAGVVHSVLEADGKVVLRLSMAGGTIGASTVKQPGVDYQHLIDASVLIQGTAAPTFNASRQMTGARLFFPGLEQVTVLKPHQPDALSVPVQSIDSLMRFDPNPAWLHRHHIRGTVALYWPGRAVCIQDDSGGICAQTTEKIPLADGSIVDVAGFATLAGFKPAFEDAVLRALPGAGTVAIDRITPEQALQGDHEAELVHIDGRLIGRDLAASNTTLVLSSGEFVFRVTLPGSIAEQTIDAIQIGSLLRVTGICSVKVDTEGTLLDYGLTKASQFSILLRSPQDILILQTASWWTAGRLRLIALYLLLTILAVAVWVYVLRRRVEQQTREIRESRECYRHMAHHDSLTGLPTRALLQEHLQAGLERSKRFNRSLALLMLDLDNFKHINDSYGHESGDQVLRVIAERLSATIRKTDSVARMGGDEFIVLLNDLVNPGYAEVVAAKIVALLSQPVQVGKIEVAVSVSVGVCTVCTPLEDSIDARSLLRRVDAAMYRAKASGRGCFRVFTEDLIAIPLNQLLASPSALLKSEQPAWKGPVSDEVAL